MRPADLPYEKQPLDIYDPGSVRKYLDEIREKVGQLKDRIHPGAFIPSVPQMHTWLNEIEALTFYRRKPR